MAAPLWLSQICAHILTQDILHVYFKLNFFHLHKVRIRWLIMLVELSTHFIYQASSCLIIELLIKTKVLVSLYWVPHSPHSDEDHNIQPTAEYCHHHLFFFKFFNVFYFSSISHTTVQYSIFWHIYDNLLWIFTLKALLSCNKSSYYFLISFYAALPLHNAHPFFSPLPKGSTFLLSFPFEFR